MTVHILLGEFFAVAGAYIAGRNHLDEWILHGIARMRGGQWFTARRHCPGCSRRVHIMRASGLAVAAGHADGYLCCRCASGIAPVRRTAEPSAGEQGPAGTSVRVQPSRPAETRSALQDEDGTDERNGQ